MTCSTNDPARPRSGQQAALGADVVALQVPDAGHNLPLEAPKAFAHAVREAIRIRVHGATSRREEG